MSARLAPLPPGEVRRAPSLLRAKQARFSQPCTVGAVLRPFRHLRGLPWLLRLRLLPALGLQGRTQCCRWGPEGGRSPPYPLSRCSSGRRWPSGPQECPAGSRQLFVLLGRAALSEFSSGIAPTQAQLLPIGLAEPR